MPENVIRFEALLPVDQSRRDLRANDCRHAGPAFERKFSHLRDHGEAAQSALLEELARDVYRLEPSAAVDIERAKERSFEAP